MKTKPASSLEKHQWQKAFKWLLWKGQQQRASDSEHLCPIYLVPKAVQERCFFAVLYTWCGNPSEVAKHFFSDCNCLVIWGNNRFNKVCSPTQYQEELQPVECYTIVLADNWLEISHIYYAVMFFFVCLFSVRLNLYWHLLNCYWLVLRNFNNPQSITSLSVWVWGVCLDLVQRFWHILRYIVNLHSSKGHLNRHCMVE